MDLEPLDALGVRVASPVGPLSAPMLGLNSSEVFERYRGWLRMVQTAGDSRSGSTLQAGATLFRAAVRSRWFIPIATFAFVFYFYWLITDGTLAPDYRSMRWYISPQFFWLQADAILHGRLNIDPNLFGGLSNSANGFRGECWYSGGECFGYFGVFPSVIRLPFVILLGNDNNGYTPVFLTAGIGVSYWFSMDLVRKVLAERQPFKGTSSEAREAVWLVFAAILLGPASVLLFLAQPFFYQESIGWMVAGLCLFTNLMWRWSRERKNSQLAFAILGLVAATGCRPTALPVGFIVGFGVLLFFFWNGQLTRAILTKIAVLMFLPIATAAAINLNKFGTVMPDYTYSANYDTMLSKYSKLNEGKLNGTRFLLTNLFTYLRPDSLTIDASDPWFRFRFTDGSSITYLPPLVTGSMLMESTVSLTSTMPVAVLLAPFTFLALATRRVFRSLSNCMELVLFGALCGPPLVMCLVIGGASRYLCDFYPLMALVVALSPALFARFASVDRIFWRAVTVVAFAMTLLSAVVLRQLLGQV